MGSVPFSFDGSNRTDLLRSSQPQPWFGVDHCKTKQPWSCSSAPTPTTADDGMTGNFSFVGDAVGGNRVGGTAGREREQEQLLLEMIRRATLRVEI